MNTRLFVKRSLEIGRAVRASEASVSAAQARSFELLSQMMAASVELGLPNHSPDVMSKAARLFSLLQEADGLAVALHDELRLVGHDLAVANGIDPKAAGSENKDFPQEPHGHLRAV